MSPLKPSWAPVLAGLCVALAAPSSPARAQDFELDRFQPTTSVRQGYITVDDGRAGRERDVEVGVWLHYADDPLVFTFGARRLPEGSGRRKKSGRSCVDRSIRYDPQQRPLGGRITSNSLLD